MKRTQDATTLTHIVNLYPQSETHRSPSQPTLFTHGAHNRQCASPPWKNKAENRPHGLPTIAFYVVITHLYWFTGLTRPHTCISSTRLHYTMATSTNVRCPWSPLCFHKVPPDHNETFAFYVQVLKNTSDRKKKKKKSLHEQKFIHLRHQFLLSQSKVMTCAWLLIQSSSFQQQHCES